MTSSAVAEIGIIGAGQFGSYFARQLERVGLSVHLADVREGTDGFARSLRRVGHSQVVVFAVPIRSLEGAIIATRDLLDPEAVVMDVCSVKMVPCAALERHLPGRATVGTHPLFGPQSAPVSCAGQRVALCASRRPDGSYVEPSAVERVEHIFARLGLNVVRCTPAEHDAQVARSQFLTHFIGRGAERSGIERVALATKTHDALMDIIDVVCHDSMELFEDMAAFNPMVPAVRASFLRALRDIEEQLRRREAEVQGSSALAEQSERPTIL